MKKFIFGFFLLLITITVGIYSFKFLEKPTDVFISPNEKYRVELYGNKKRPWFFTNTVAAKIFSNGNIIANTQIHSGDAFDISFESAYKFIAWQNDRVLRFGYEDKNLEKDVDVLTVTNNSSEKLKYLEIRFCEDKYLMFELNTGESQVLTKKHLTPADVYVSGEFENGFGFESGSSFPYTEKSIAENPFHICVSLKNSENESKNNIAKITDCSQ
jgi:hypothetical protein